MLSGKRKNAAKGVGKLTDAEKKDSLHEGRDENFMDIDRMTNEGLGGGNVTQDNGLIEETTVDTMRFPEDVADNEDMV